MDSIEQFSGRLQSSVAHLAGDIGERNPERHAQLQEARRWIARSLKEAGGAPVEQTYTLAGHEYANVILSISGRTPNLLPIVLGAHYDSVEGTPGADDNASGVAVLLELARHFQKHPAGRPLELCFFTLEEAPYFAGEEMGSARLAEAWRKQGRRIELMVSLEMLGFFSNDIPQQYPVPTMREKYPANGNFLAVVALPQPHPSVQKLIGLLQVKAELPVESVFAPRQVRGVDFSDHRSFWDRGFPALMLTDTAFYRNSHYHQPSDRPETLNYEAMARVTRSLIQVVELWDAQP